MISDEKRRRAAAELREASTGAYHCVDVLDVIAGSIGVDIAGKFCYEAEKEAYAALADFIDRPTTTLTEDEDGRTCCASCGCAALYMPDAAYCPDCGAEVVEAND